MDGALPPSNLATLGLLNLISSQVAGGFTQAGQLLNGAINPLAFGAISSNRAPNGEHTLLLVRDNTPMTRSHWGADVS